MGDLVKTYRHLYEKFISDENIRVAIHEAAKGNKDKRFKAKLQRIRDNADKYIPICRKYAIEYVGEPHREVEIYDGIGRKKRKIIVPDAMEQIYSNMIVNVLKPIFMKGICTSTYGSVPGRGSQGAKKVIERWIRKDPGGCKYCFKFDVKKYFNSISQDILMRKLIRIIKDEDFLSRIEEILKVAHCGLPLGFRTSQWFAIWYLQDFDHYVKEKLHVKKYIRWMDDGVIFLSNKKKLQRIRENISAYLKENVGLILNERTQLFRFHIKGKKGRDVDFMGYRFWRNRTTLRRAIYYKACHKALMLSKKEKITAYDCKQMITWFAWFKITDTYSSYLKYIKPYADYKYMRKRVSAYDRRENHVERNTEYGKTA